MTFCQEALQDPHDPLFPRGVEHRGCVVHHSLLVLLLIEWLVQDMGEHFRVCLD